MHGRGPGDERMLRALEQLLELPSANLRTAMVHACDLVAELFAAQKVDLFLYDPTRDSLVALGSSEQPLSALQKKHGLDVLQVANGGRVVRVFTDGEPYVDGRVDEDAEELRGIRDTLGIRSQLGVPLEIGGVVRGAMMIASREPDQFAAEDVRFATSVARWIGIVAHRAELVEEISRNALEQGRRAAAEELVTVLAHDMKNYLSPLSIRLDLLERRARADARDKDLREVSLAQRSLARIDALVSDLLDVARIDTGLFDLDLRPLDLLALVDDVASTLSSKQLPILVRANEDILVQADAARVRQALHNVLANAVAHSPANGSVTVLIAREPHEHVQLARVDVIDEGPGVPPELVPRIFERFVRGAKKTGGLGLGLYIAKRIAVMHDGDLTLTSSSEGTRFTLTLPCCE